MWFNKNNKSSLAQGYLGRKPYNYSPLMNANCNFNNFNLLFNFNLILITLFFFDKSNLVIRSTLSFKNILQTD